MNRLARSHALLALVVLFALGSGEAHAATPSLTVDTSYGEAATHSAALGRIDNQKLDVRGIGVDSKRRLSLIGNNGWEDPSNAGPVQCAFTTVRRLTANGSIDKSFGRDGVFRFPKAGVSVCAGAVTIDSRDRVIGTARIVYKNNRRTRVVFRLTTLGKLDKSFGNGGIVRLGAGNWGSPLGWGGTGEPMLVKGDKLVLVTVDYLRYDFVRLRSDGRIDRSYGKNGHSIVKGINEGLFERDERDRIYIAGVTEPRTRSYGGERAVVHRLTASGEPDRSYGKKGTVLVAKANDKKARRAVWIREIHVLANGRIHLDDRGVKWAVFDASGKRESKWSRRPLFSAGTVFGLDKRRRAATLISTSRDTDNNQNTDEGRQLSVGVAADGFDGASFSAPVEILRGGQLEWFGLGAGGHDLYTVTIFGVEFANDLDTDTIRVQRLKLNW